MLLILFWVSFLIFYFSYLFSVFFLGLLILFMAMVYFGSLMYVKFLIILVYISGVVVFILYISCLCWGIGNNIYWFLVFFGFFGIYLVDFGLFSLFGNMGEFLWMYLLYAFIFNSLVLSYTLNLFKVSGSLRF